MDLGEGLLLPLGCLRSQWSPSEMALAPRLCWLGLGSPVSLVSGSFSDSLITLGKFLYFSVPHFPSLWRGEKQQCIPISTSSTSPRCCED